MRYPLESLYDDVAQIQHESRTLFGSGRLIGHNLVLTARHVLTEEGSVTPLSQGWQVRLMAARPAPQSPANWPWIRAHIAWVGQDNLDLALLWLVPEQPTTCLIPRLRLKIARIDRVEHHLVRGLGFPRGAKVENRRILVVPSGHLSDETGPTLSFGIDQAYLPELPAADWRGFSGASVVLEESGNLAEVWVYGIAQHVPSSFTRQLAVARLASAFEDESFRSVLESAQVSLALPADPFWPGQTIIPWYSTTDCTAYIDERRQHFSGRGWLFDKVNHWLRKTYPRALLVSADYGVGKTAFMAELVHCTRKYPDRVHAKIVGWHFCRHGLGESLDPSVFISGIAAQLIANIPDYRAVIEANPALLVQLEKAGDDPSGIFEAVVLNVLAKLPAPAQPMLILVDALDEALEYGRPNNIITSLASRMNLFPPWLRILVTSRNNEDVISPLQSFGLERISADDNDNLEDIYDYVLQRCQEEPLVDKLKGAGKTKEEMAAKLRDSCGGKFLYVVLVLGDIVNGRLDLRDSKAMPRGMDNFYKNSFERYFSHGSNEYEPAGQLLGLIAAAREPLSISVLAEVARTTEDAVGKSLEILVDFVSLNGGCFFFNHISVFEWLTQKGVSRRRAGRFAINLELSMKVLTEWAWGYAESSLQHAPDYVLHHLPLHLLDMQDFARLHVLLCRFEWLQAKLFRFGIHALLADFERLPLYLRNNNSIDLLYRTLGRCGHILRHMPEQLATQLLGRLRAGLTPEIDNLRKDTWNWCGQTWLRPQWANITPDTLLLVLEGHTSWVTDVAFSPDGIRIVSAGNDSTVRLWSAGTGQPLCPPLEGHSGQVSSVAFSPDGRYVVSGGQDGTMRLWDTLTGGSCLPPFGHRTGWVSSVAFSPDGSCIVSAGENGIVQLWDVRTGHLVRQSLKRHVGWTTRVAFRPDGRRIISAGNDGTIRQWDAETCQPQRPELEGHTGWVGSVAFSPDGSRIVSGGDDKTVRLWDAATGQSLRQPLEGHAHPVRSVAFSPDGGRIVSADPGGIVRIWDANTGESLKSPLEGYYARDPAGFSPDGSRISTVDDWTVRIWDSMTGRSPRPPLEGRTGWVWGLAFSPDGTRIVSAGDDKTVRLWDTTTGQPLWPPLEGHTGAVRSVAFSPDGRCIASGGNDRIVRLWNARNGQPLRPLLEGHTSWVRCVVFSPDGSCIASAGDDRTIRLWDVATGQPLLPPLEGHTSWVRCIAFSSDGSQIVSAGADRTVRMWDRATGQLLRLPLEGHTGRVLSVAISPDSERIVSIDDDGVMRLWDVRTGQLLQRLLEGEARGVNSVAFFPDGRIISVDDHGIVRLLDAGKTVNQAFCEGALYALAVCKTHIATGGRKGILQVFRVIDQDTARS